MLTAITIEHLTTGQRSQDTGVAYLYCNFRRQDEQTAGHLLASLLQQLSQTAPSLPDSVKTLYDSHKHKKTRPSFDEISKALQSVAPMYTRVYIFLDALDECQVSDGCRARFLAGIFTVQAKSGINIFATSRYIPEIVEAFEGSVTQEIRADDEDVRRYLNGQMLRLPGFVRRNDELQEEVKTGIIQSVRGM